LGPQFLVGKGSSLDQAAGEQGPDDAVDVDAANGTYSGPGDGLSIGDDRKGLQSCLGELGLLPVQEELLDDGCVLRAAVDPPSSGDLPDRESMVALVVVGCQGAQVADDIPPPVAPERRPATSRSPVRR